MGESLRGARAKFKRAVEHRDQLAACLGQDAIDNAGMAGRFNKRYDEAAHCFIYSLPDGRMADDGWSLLLGDFLTNSRSVLDYIVWELSQLDPPLKGKENSVAFPVVSVPKGTATLDQTWDMAVKQNLHSVAPFHVQMIRRHQPFRRANPQTHPLEWLDRLCNLDKHRSLRVGFSRAFKGQVTPKPVEVSNFTDLRFVPSPPESINNPETEIIRIYGTPTGDEPPHIKMNFTKWHWAFATDNLFIEPMMNGIVDYLRAVLDEFDRVMP